jgi:hypothetical protein
MRDVSAKFTEAALIPGKDFTSDSVLAAQEAQCKPVTGYVLIIGTCTAIFLARF